MSADSLDPNTVVETLRQPLRRLILTLADSKRMMGIRYSDWVLGAPSIETGVAASSMSQDEWGHARLLYAMLRDLGMDPTRVEHGRSAGEYASLDGLDDAFEDWACVVAGMVVVDGALAVALEGFSEGRYEPARTRVPKMLAEEEFHASLGRAWYRRLSGSGSGARELLAQATSALLPATLAWLGASDAAAGALAKASVTPPGPHLLTRFRDRTRELLAESGVDVDAARPATEWDPSRARGPGHPAEEAVERARGDRNRALLVE